MTASDNDPPPFFFGVPLRARSTSKDWFKVCRNLRRTLTNLLGQSDQRFRILLACHDVPDFLAAEPFAGRVEILPAEELFPPAANPDEYFRDMFRKRRLQGSWIKASGAGHCYFMTADADDLVHRHLVAHVLRSDNRRGYIVQRGFILDEGNQLLGALDEKGRPFYQQSGSCAVVYFKSADLPESYEDESVWFSKFDHHKLFPRIAKQAERPLSLLPFYAAVYVVNHGENNRLHRGFRDEKVAITMKHCIGGAPAIAKISPNFPGLRTAPLLVTR